MKVILLKIVFYVNFFSLYYILIINTIYFGLLIVAAFQLTNYIKRLRYVQGNTVMEAMTPVSLLVPAYNESATIVDNVRSLLNLNYPEYEVIVINDGSKDETLELLIKNFGLKPIDEIYRERIKTEKVRKVYRTPKYPNLIVIDKFNGGKADALNAGINISDYPIFAAIDADSILEKDSLLWLTQPFFYDREVVAVGGIVRIASGCKIEKGRLVKTGISKNFWAKLQTVEYLRAFLTGRMGFDSLGSLLIISGAFGAFRKQMVIDAGGYTKDCVGEDMELVVNIHKQMRRRKIKYKIRFVPDPICWTQPPESYKDLKRQRIRWHIGLMSSLFRHKDMFLNPKYGVLGMFGIPFFWIFEMIGPIIETIGYIIFPISYFLGVINFQFMITFFVLSVLYGLILSLGALASEEYFFKKYQTTWDLIHLILYTILDNFGYRHLNNIFKIEAFFKYNKQKHSWGSLKRKTFSGN